MLQLNRHTWGYTKTGTRTNSHILSAEGIHILVFAKMLTGMKNPATCLENQAQNAKLLRKCSCLEMLYCTKCWQILWSDSLMHVWCGYCSKRYKNNTEILNTSATAAHMRAVFVLGKGNKEILHTF